MNPGIPSQIKEPSLGADIIGCHSLIEPRLLLHHPKLLPDYVADHDIGVATVDLAMFVEEGFQ